LYGHAICYHRFWHWWRQDDVHFKDYIKEKYEIFKERFRLFIEKVKKELKYLKNKLKREKKEAIYKYVELNN
jgi:hypothetical protein